jgi:hypothetical protein
MTFTKKVGRVSVDLFFLRIFKKFQSRETSNSKEELIKINIYNTPNN